MTAQQALELVDGVIAQYATTREEHDRLKVAVETLAEAISGKHDEEDAVLRTVEG